MFSPVPIRHAGDNPKLSSTISLPSQEARKAKASKANRKKGIALDGTGGAAGAGGPPQPPPEMCPHWPARLGAGSDGGFLQLQKLCMDVSQRFQFPIFIFDC